MLEKPEIADQQIIACLQDHYGLLISHIAFLPLGVDPNAAVYRVVTDAQMAYFLKLRRGAFDQAAVALPKYFSDQGLAQIIAPLASLSGQLWGKLDDFNGFLYPFVVGRDGYEAGLSDYHWADLGAAMRRIHSTRLPSTILQYIRRETYSAQWRERVKVFLERVEIDSWQEPIAQKTADLLSAKRSTISDLVLRSARLAQALQLQTPELVVCHTDLHAGNILIDHSGALFIVDWDSPLLAPKERDLMFIGSGLMGNRRSLQEEEALFYPAYGETSINKIALAYYRYERIIEDIAVFCEQLLLTDAGGADRESAFHYLASNFLPNKTIEIAYRSDTTDSI